MSKLLFVADLHGNRYAYERALELARERNVDSVVFGGDLTPKKIAVKLNDTYPEEEEDMDNEDFDSIEIIPGEVIPMDMVQEDLATGTYTESLEQIRRLNDRWGSVELESELRKNGYIIHPINSGFYNLEDMLMENRLIDKLFGFFSTYNGVSRRIAPFELTEEEQDMLFNSILQNLREYESTLDDTLKQRTADNWSLYLSRLKKEFERIPFSRLFPSNTLETFFRFRNKFGEFEDQYDSLQKSINVGDEEVAEHIKRQLGENLRDVQVAVTMAEIYGDGILDMIKHLGKYTPIGNLQDHIRDERVSEKGQLDFIRGYLRNILSEHRQGNPNSRIFTILGNDDITDVEPVVRELEQEGLLHYLNSDVSELQNGIYVAGYPYVKSSDGGFYPEWEKREEEMEKDLDTLAEKSDPKKTVYVLHSPPHNTRLDVASNGEHIGNKAVRRFIEKYQPLMVLSGHVHESPRNTGKVMDMIGETPCYNPGGEHDKDKLCAVVIGTDDIGNYERIYG